MAYKVKGKFYWSTYLDPTNNDGYCAVNFTSNSTVYNSIWCFGVDYVVYYGDEVVGHSTSFLNEYYYTVDFGSDYQEINEWLYNLLISKATALDGGSIIEYNDIIINITSPNGVTLATEKTIVNSNIKVTIDESLLGNDTSDATAAADEIFAGKTAYIADGKVDGTFTIENELSEQDELINCIQTLVATKASIPDSIKLEIKNASVIDSILYISTK